MRRLLLWVALAVVSVRPLAAETFLYATAATPGRIDVFRVLADGALSAAPVTQNYTSATYPRRLITRGCNLYVAESDRVEVFAIRADGALKLCGATRHWDQTRAHDIGLSADGKTLYVPVRRQGAIATYPLDDKGRPNLDLEPQGNIMAGAPVSCVYSPANGADWEDIQVANGKIYAAYSNAVEAYGIVDGAHCSNDLAKACTSDADCVEVVSCIVTDNGLRCSNDLDNTCTVETVDTDCDKQGTCATNQLVGSARVPTDLDDDGTIEAGETDCTPAEYSNTPALETLPCVEKAKDFPKNRPSQSCFFSHRDHIDGIGLKVDGSTLVVSTRFSHRLDGFTLDSTGNFPPVYSGSAAGPEPTDKTEQKAWKKQRKKDRKLERKCRKRNRTDEFIRYIGLTLHKPANAAPLIFGTGFSGRTDAFRFEIDENRKPTDPACDAFEPPMSPKLSRQPGSHTPKNVISTPTRSAIGMTAQGKGVLYIAAGELDRVQAFRLFAEGGVDPDEGPMETNEIQGSFPNDVVLVDTTSCPVDIADCD